DRILVSLRDDFLLNQVATLIYGELQLTGEHAERYARERDRQVRLVRLHLAVIGFVGRGCAVYLVRFARLPNGAPVTCLAGRDIERRIPEWIPLILFEYLRSDFFEAVLLEPFPGFPIHATAPGRDAEFRGGVGRKCSPGSSLPSRRQFRDGRCSVV